MNQNTSTHTTPVSISIDLNTNTLAPPLLYRSNRIARLPIRPTLSSCVSQPPPTLEPSSHRGSSMSKFAALERELSPLLQKTRVILAKAEDERTPQQVLNAEAYMIQVREGEDEAGGKGSGR
jgi:hypothetical protein